MMQTWKINRRPKFNPGSDLHRHLVEAGQTRWVSMKAAGEIDENRAEPQTDEEYLWFELEEMGKGESGNRP